MKIYHTTPIKNLESIREYGLHSNLEGVYFSENPISALKWVSLGRPGRYAVIEIDVKGRTGLKPGRDHSPIMEFMFPGNVWVSKKPRHTISKVLIFDVELDSNGSTGEINIVGTMDGFVANNTTDNPFKKKNQNLREELIKSAREHLAKSK